MRKRRSTESTKYRSTEPANQWGRQNGFGPAGISPLLQRTERPIWITRSDSGQTPLKAVIDGIGTALVRVGPINESRARETADLAWPRTVTGFARMSQSAADLAMVGTAVGAAAITGLGFASPFWLLGVTLALGLSGGTIS